MHLNWRMPLGGALRGTLPNPTLASIPAGNPEDASGVIAARVFGPRASSGETSTTTSTPGGSGALELVQDITLGATATSVTFSGLDGDADRIYLFQYRVAKAVAATTIITINPNGLTTGQHSWSSFFGSSTGTYDFAVLDIDRNGASASGDLSSGSFWIYAESGTARIFRGGEVQFRAAQTFNIDIIGTWSDTATNITSLVVVCDQANGLGAGSYFRLYRLTV